MKVPADQVHASTLAALKGLYAKIVTTDELLERGGEPAAAALGASRAPSMPVRSTAAGLRHHPADLLRHRPRLARRGGETFYPRHLAHLLSANVNWSAAILFYLVFIAGIVFFAVKPALEAGNSLRALAYGAFFGFLAYATYDLTNHATMKDWPAIVTVVDLAWGTVLTGTVAVATYLVSRRLG